MKPENRNQDCREHCPRFQQAKSNDRESETLALAGNMTNPSLGQSARVFTHLEIDTVAEDTFGCRGPKREDMPNKRILHRLLGTGPNQATVYTCQAPDTK